MSKEQRKQMLQQKAEQFVTEVIRDVYGQKLDAKTVRMTADRVVAGIPMSIYSKAGAKPHGE